MWDWCRTEMKAIEHVTPSKVEVQSLLSRQMFKTNKNCFYISTFKVVSIGLLAY